MRTLIAILLVATLSGCDEPVDPHIPIEAIPPGASHFHRLDYSWYTYEFGGQLVLVHHYTTNTTWPHYDSVSIKALKAEDAK